MSAEIFTHNAKCLYTINRAMSKTGSLLHMQHDKVQI